MMAFHTLKDILVDEVYAKPGKTCSSFVISTYLSKSCLSDNNMLLWKCQNKIFKIFQYSENVVSFPGMNVTKVMVWLPEKSSFV